LTLDTPLTLQDGRLLRVYIEPAKGGGLIVTDGGYAMSQVETFARTPAMLRERREELVRIARILDLECEDGTEFCYVSNDLEAAMMRLNVLSMAVNRALSLLHAKPPRLKVALRERLLETFRSAGLEVKRDAQITSGQSELSVTVDYRVNSKRKEAAVEVLSGRTRAGAQGVVDRTAANFNVLAKGGYRGLLVAVYDEQSIAAHGALRERFLEAGPKNVLLLSGNGEERQIVERLAA